MIESRQAPCFRPSLDVHAEEGELVVHAELPGMRLEEIALRIDRGELVLAGEHLQLPFATPEGRYRTRFAGGVLEVRVPIP